MSKIVSDPRLPTVNDENIRPLTQRLYELFRQYAIAHNKSYMWDTEGTSAPTTGTWAVSQMCKNTAPSGDSLTIGWVCTTSGTPGTWTAINSGTSASYREILTGNRTYYVRTDGSNSNNGLANTSGGAFLTIQKAMDVISSTLDLSGYVATIQVADGTYTANVLLKQTLGGAVKIIGNNTTPANCIIVGTIYNSGNFLGYLYEVSGFKLTLSNGAHFSLSGSGANVYIYSCEFGTTTNTHIQVTRGASVYLGSYAIIGGAARHISIDLGGLLTHTSSTVTITGTPAFSGAYVTLQTSSVLQSSSLTFTGSATGIQYSVSENSVFSSAGQYSSYPGNVGGSYSTGGQVA